MTDTPDAKQVEQLFQAARELPAESRAEYLAAQDVSDAIRHEVEELLRYDAIEQGGLSGEVADRLAATQEIKARVPLHVASPADSSLGSAIDHGQFLPGTVLARRYRIVGMLGKGGMGEVYRADDLELGQSVALKFLPQRFSQDPRSLERFRGEVRLARQVSHPNVCRVYDIAQIDDQWFLSMEYVDGEDLSQLLTRIGRFPADRATELARQLCLGLNAAHEQGVLHRDLKPANIMIDGRGKLLITDFGLAELAADVREDDIRSGTPAYMSPEQLAGREVTARSDIYSLGIILHEIYTGKTVWQAGSVAELLTERNNTPLPTTSRHDIDLDPQVEQVIWRCLQPDPEQRPPSAISVIASLPGGDPLQAAIAAGETPSPQMVADSGDEGQLPLLWGVLLYALIWVLAIAMPFFVDWRQLYNFGNLAENKPEVLEKQAVDYARALGYETAAVDHAAGFQVDDQRQLEFWYRHSHQQLVPSLPPLWAMGTSWQVSTKNPALIQHASVAMRLDSGGRLLEFLAVSSSEDLSGGDDLLAGPQDHDWEQWFADVGLEPADYVLRDDAVDAPRQRPPTYTDEIRYWKSQSTDDDSQVVMAVYQGKLTYFHLFQGDQTNGLVRDFRAGSAIQSYSGMVTTVLFSIALLFAVRNLRREKFDLRIATYFSMIYFGGDLLLWIIQSGSILSLLHDRELASNYVFRSIASATRLWFYYVAFEPIVRRYWPGMLVSWARLTAGRIRDPLVGRDLLSGCLIGIGWWWFSTSLGRSVAEVLWPFWPQTLLTRHAIAAGVASVQYAVLTGIGLLAWLLCFRIMLRSTWPAALLFVAVVAFSVGYDHWGVWVYGFTAAAVYIYFGLVTLVVAHFFTNFLAQIPITADIDSWYSSSGILAISFLIAVASYGLYSSTIRPAGGRIGV
jgi:serine/threonine-protein kinase